MSTDTLNEWMIVPEAATAARTGTRTIYREIHKGRLRAARIGGRGDIRIRRQWFEEWLDSLATPVEVTQR